MRFRRKHQASWCLFDVSAIMSRFHFTKHFLSESWISPFTANHSGNLRLQTLLDTLLASKHTKPNTGSLTATDKQNLSSPLRTTPLNQHRPYHHHLKNISPLHKLSSRVNLQTQSTDQHNRIRPSHNHSSFPPDVQNWIKSIHRK